MLPVIEINKFKKKRKKKKLLAVIFSPLTYKHDIPTGVCYFLKVNTVLHKIFIFKNYYLFNLTLLRWSAGLRNMFSVKRKCTVNFFVFKLSIVKTITVFSFSNDV